MLINEQDLFILLKINPSLLSEKVAEEWAYTAKVLQLTPPPAIGQVAAPAAAPAAPAKAPKANAASDMAL